MMSWKQRRKFTKMRRAMSETPEKTEEENMTITKYGYEKKDEKDDKSKIASEQGICPNCGSPVSGQPPVCPKCGSKPFEKKKD